MSRPKLSSIHAARLSELGLKLGLCFQPEWLFVPNGRKLKRVAEPGDPWSVNLVRRDRSILQSGHLVATATGATFEEAVESAIPTGLVASMLRLESSVGRLTETIRAR